MVKKRDDELKEFIKEKIAKIRELAPMNKELEEWIDKRDKTETDDFISLQKKITGKCQICKERPAQYRCIKCNKDACATHYWILFGLCKRCAPDSTIEKWGEDERLGIDIIK